MPGFTPLLQLLGTQQKCCLACGAMEQKGLHTCITVGCKGGRWEGKMGPPPPPSSIIPPPLTAVCSVGLYCSQCYATLNNVCSVCMGPLSYKDMGDEEM